MSATKTQESYARLRHIRSQLAECGKETPYVLDEVELSRLQTLRRCHGIPNGVCVGCRITGCRHNPDYKSMTSRSSAVTRLPTESAKS